MSTKNPRFHTPKGRAVYPRLSRPDTKFHDLGIYKADIMVPVSECRELLNTLTAFHKSHVGQAPNKIDNPMWKLELDEDGEQTGEVIFKLRVKNRLGRDGEVWDRKPKMFDASLAPCPDAVPKGGSEFIVNFEAYAWDAGGKKGVSLQPVAVQIITLVSGDEGSADGFGFKATDGFSAPESVEPVVEAETNDDADF